MLVLVLVFWVGLVESVGVGCGLWWIVVVDLGFCCLVWGLW